MDKELSRSRRIISAPMRKSRNWRNRVMSWLGRGALPKSVSVRPAERSLLLDLGRVWKASRTETTNAVLFAASRAVEPRVAEESAGTDAERYPYVYEFRRRSSWTHRTWNCGGSWPTCYLAMERPWPGRAAVQMVADGAPDDLLSAAQLGFLRLSRGDQAGATPLFDRCWPAMTRPSQTASARRFIPRRPRSGAPEELQAQGPEDAKQLAEKSFDKGYLKDALKYFKIAQENDPLDFTVMLKLGWTYNLLKDDEEAVRWFNLARRSPDPATAAEASHAYRNLDSARERWRTTVWVFPMFSTRWHDLFGYAQAKTELRLPHWSVHPYVSLRFVGDAQGAVSLAGTIGPQYLSEQSAILALGVATVPWHGMTGWFEAGEALRYNQISSGSGILIPDYRGGVSYAKGFGNLLTRGAHGLFAETNDDGVFVSRFAQRLVALFAESNWVHVAPDGRRGEFHAQLYWNWNATDGYARPILGELRRDRTGHAVRFGGMPKSLLFSLNSCAART